MTSQTSKLMQMFARRFTKVAVDATTQPGELYYAQIYLDEITRRLQAMGTGSKRLLDAGCGTGRIMIPLAKLGHQVTGIDYHRDSLRLAGKYALEAGVSADLIESDLAVALNGVQDASYDAAMAIESIYVSEQFGAILDHMARIVRGGGLLFITHRTRYFYLLRALARGDFEEARFVAHHSNGHLRKGMHKTYHHWQTRRQIEQTYETRGLELMELRGIGLGSGICDDPPSPICDPATLHPEQKQALREIETCDDELLMASRYVLAVVRNPVEG